MNRVTPLFKKFKYQESWPHTDNEGQPAKNFNGEILAMVMVLAYSVVPGAKPASIEVKVPQSAMPKQGFADGMEIDFVNLQATAWGFNGKSGLSFSAESVSAVPAAKAAS
jgi:hypothetical protein